MTIAASDNKPRISATKLFLGRWGGALVMVALLLCVGMPSVAHAVPVNPQRPFIATDCEAAKARLNEALLGNPLVSDAEMRDVVITARKNAERLCGHDLTQDIISDFNANKLKTNR